MVRRKFFVCKMQFLGYAILSIAILSQMSSTQGMQVGKVIRNHSCYFYLKDGCTD